MTLTELLESVRRVNDTMVGASFQPLLQFRRIARTVEYSKHGKCPVLDGKVNGVFLEAPQTDSSGAATHGLKYSWIGQRPLQRGFHFKFEFFTQPDALRFISRNGLFKFQTGRRFEDDWQTHCQPKRLLSLASTSSHGIPSCGFLSNSARRRSSSADCSAVSPSSKAPNFSQMISATARCSPGGNCSICSRICAALMAAIYSFDLPAQAGVLRWMISSFTEVSP
jgi:hypothetical protein